MDSLISQSFISSSNSAANQALITSQRDMHIAARAGKLDEKTLAKIDEASKEYEAVFLTEMLNHMFKDISFDPMNGDKSAAQDIYKQHLVKEYASMLTENGGVGLAKDIRSQLIEIQSMAYKGE